jgi:geranylgeranyl reductase family protein
MSASPSVLVVGGGPAGSAAAFWLARDGHDVTLVEKKEYPREKTCGDGLTPRAILQLQDMGFDFDVPEFHRVSGLRSYAGPDLKLEMQWPEHSRFPNWGGVIRRKDLDAQVAMLAEKEGVRIRQRTSAKPVISEGRVASVELTHDGETDVAEPDYVVVADGSLSRFGRDLGTSRRRDYPMGLAARGYFDSPRSDDGFLESQLDIRDASGAAMPGYGWIFPLGDGTVNVGVGLLSTFKRWKHVNTSDMMAAYVDSAPDYWELTNPTDHRGGKLSMAFSVGPKYGANWMVVGDAAGAINPWNGEGISYAYETGRIAAGVLGDVVGADDPSLLARYPQILDDEFGEYYRFARLFVKAIGYPQVMQTLTHVGLRSKPLMEWVLKVMANLLEEDEQQSGVSEAAYRALEAVVRRAPTSVVEL